MNHLSRREFCTLATALGATALTAPQTLLAQQPAPLLSLTIDPTTKFSRLPLNYMGLSYESGQLAYPDYFSPQNKALIEIFRALSPSGVLRLGGNLSEFTIWSETEPTTQPERGGLVGPDPGKREPRTFTITPNSIRNLQGFLTATGWRCIYGLNLGGGSLEQALAEASFVYKTLDRQLLYVQFGNEPDLFKHHDQNNKPWSYEEYLAKWKTFRAAFHDKLPNVDVAGPDTAYNHEWVKRFTLDVPKEVVACTSHYYPLGPPTDPKMTIDLLLHPGVRFESSCHSPIESSKAAGLPFRMAEGNSCYNAGKPGVSDTLASALWAGDYCLQMASLGCVGVNLHSGANGYYSPIVGSILTGFSTRPEYYGLLLAQQFAGHELVSAKLDTKGANITAYATAFESGSRLVAVFNKDENDVDIELNESAGAFNHAAIQRLKGPTIDSKTDVTFVSGPVDANGHPLPHNKETLHTHKGQLIIHVPASSAALIRLT
jgi:hypothetical protein